MLKPTSSTTFSEDFAQNDRTILYFTAPWCGPCRQLSPIVEQLSEECDLSVLKINIDEALDLASQYDIRQVPTLLFFNDRTPIDQISGNVPPRQLRERFEAHRT